MMCTGQNLCTASAPQGTPKGGIKRELVETQGVPTEGFQMQLVRMLDRQQSELETLRKRVDCMDSSLLLKLNSLEEKVDRLALAFANQNQ